MARWIVLPLVWGALALLSPPGAAVAASPWVITFLDVGQGDSSLLQMPDGHDVLIDAGTPEMGGRVVAELQRLGVKALDMVIMTHPHADHIGGLPAVFDAFPVRLALDAGAKTSSRVYREALEGIDNHGIALKLGRSGLSKSYGDVTMDVLAPEDPLLTGTRSDLNNASIVTRWRYKHVTLLETGDAEQAALERLLKGGADVAAQILKVPHHGSRYTSSPAFLAAVHPEVAVVSCASPNDYHHPHGATLKRLAKVGAKVYVTAQEGDITVKSDGETYTVDTRQPYAEPRAGDAGVRATHKRSRKHKDEEVTP